MTETRDRDTPGASLAASARATGSRAGETTGRQRVTHLIEWTARHPRAPLLLALVLAVVARLVLVARTHAMIDGDEALVGIQAENILRGQHPTYFYGQPYMGSLEAYLAAAIFRVFGPSTVGLRMVPIALSLVVVALTWRLALALLPRDARTTPLLAGVAALVAAVPPLYDAVAELRTWGGQIEIYTISLALLLVTVELAASLRRGNETQVQPWRWGLLGFLAGLGIWINPLVSYALVACALWLLPALFPGALPSLWRRLPRRARSAPAAEGALDAKREGQPAARPATGASPFAALPGLALGGLPAWIYALRHGGENLLVYISQPQVDPAVSGAARHGRLFLGAAITAKYATCVAPHVLDGGLPAEPLAWLPLRLLVLLPPLVGIACALWVVATRGRVAADAGLPRLGLPLLYAGIVTAVFCLGTSAWPATHGRTCAIDWAGRYAVPLALVEPFLLLGLLAAPALWQRLRQRGNPRTPTPDAHPTPTTGSVSRGWNLALLVVVLVVALHGITYPLADPASTFQSPFFRRIPLDDTQLLDYLRQQHIRAAWANHWLGNIVTFQTNGATVCADYYDQVAHQGIQRPPGTLHVVAGTERASFILVVQDAHPQLAQRLDALGVRYTLAVLPQAGVTVITPASTVNPALVADALGQDYPY